MEAVKHPVVELMAAEYAGQRSAPYVNLQFKIKYMCRLRAKIFAVSIFNDNHFEIQDGRHNLG